MDYSVCLTGCPTQQDAWGLPKPVLWLSTVSPHLTICFLLSPLLIVATAVLLLEEERLFSGGCTEGDTCRLFTGAHEACTAPHVTHRGQHLSEKGKGTHIRQPGQISWQEPSRPLLEEQLAISTQACVGGHRFLRGTSDKGQTSVTASCLPTKRISHPTRESCFSNPCTLLL